MNLKRQEYAYTVSKVCPGGLLTIDQANPPEQTDCPFLKFLQFLLKHKTVLKKQMIHRACLFQSKISSQITADRFTTDHLAIYNHSGRSDTNTVFPLKAAELQTFCSWFMLLYSISKNKHLGQLRTVSLGSILGVDYTNIKMYRR